MKDEIRGKEVIWLEDPTKYDYLRVHEIQGCSPNYRGAFKYNEHCKLVGYTKKSEYLGNRTYKRIIFWLRQTDRGMPLEKEGYGIEPDGSPFKPTEGIFVREILLLISNQLNSEENKNGS